VELPVELLNSLKEAKGFDRNAFEKVHHSGEQVISIRTNPSKWLKSPQATGHFAPATKVPWAQHGFYLADRPSFTFDPLFHAGCYYVQEASSMFLEQVVIQMLDLSKPLRLLDLCAAPGGKSTHLQSLIPKESLLVSNELIRSRALVLKDNMIKWGGENVMVTQNDPGDFSEMDDFFDMIVVDAPCSGSGLFRRDPGTIAEWSENNVRLCSQRQQKIISAILPAL
jgi:16S rRNA C967 or C1407 C5-methylase (RsmB/RsmF family)